MTKLAALEAVTFGDLTDSAIELLDRAVRAVKVETTLGPTIYIPSPFRRTAEPTVASQGIDVGRILKPKFTFEMRQGWGSNRSFAPYGDPGPSRWGFVVAGLIGLVVLAGYGGASLRRRR